MLDDKMWQCGPRPLALSIDPNTTTTDIMRHDNIVFDYGTTCDRILHENHKMLLDFSEEWKKWEAVEKAKK